MSLLQPANAVTPYQPDITPYAIEPYAWPEVEGLPNDSLFDITTDKNSHLWMGGANAILKYDGETLTKYTPNNIEENLGSYTYSLAVRDDGELFAMSRSQMFHFNKTKWQAYGPPVSPIPSGFWVQKRITFGKDNFWQKSSEDLLRINQDEFEYIHLDNGHIEHFIIDQQGYFWVLFRQSKSVKRFAYNKGKFIELNHWPRLMENTQQSKIVQLTHSELWIISQDPKQPPLALNIQNINKNQTSSHTWKQIRYPTTNGFSNQAVISDTDNNILLFSSSHLHLKTPEKWYSVPLNTLNITRDILSLKQASNGDIWLLELGKAVRRFNPVSPRQMTFNDLMFGCESQNSEFFINKAGYIIQHNQLTDSWLKHEKTKQLISTPLNLLCTQQNDIIVYGSDNKTAAISVLTAENVLQSPDKALNWQKILLPQLHQNIGLLSAIELQNGDIYLGRNDELPKTQGVIVKLQKKKDGYKISNIPLDYYYNRVATIAELPDNQLAFSNSNLQILSLNKTAKTTNSTAVTLPNNFVAAWIEGLAADSRDNLWVATWHYGVLAFNNGQWRQYALNEGLSGKNAASIARLSNDDIVALTHNGVDRFDGAVWQPLDIYGVKAIREGSNLVEGSDSTIWVNQASREWTFRYQRPYSYNSFEYHQQQDIFKTIRYQATKMAPSVEIELANPLIEYQNSVLVSWRGFDQWFETSSANLKYSYRVNDGEWSIFSSDTSHAFTNLSPKTYTIEVRSRDADGNTSKSPASLSFTISAPFWQQTWFYIVITVIFVLMLTTLLVLIAQRLKQKSQINQARMEFLTHISHELRNPLALIISPIEEYFQQHPKQKNYGLQLALRNANRLKELINQLLDYRRLQAGNIKLENKPNDLIQMLKILIADLHFIADKKQQSINFLSPLNHYHCLFDYDVMRKIIENLITNALKYSDKHASVIVIVNKHSSGIKISVEDNGIGIPLNEQAHIFTPFYSQKKHRFDNHNSFGIGLSLVNDLVALNHGNIKVESPIKDSQHGSRFTLTFNHLTEIKSASTNVTHKPNDSTSSNSINIPIASHSLTTEPSKQKVHVLLVDDNIELTQYLLQELSADFQCHVEHNGKQALTYAINNIPDIIISDYKMPEMDGLELCQALKNNIATSHIPLLLHTAMTSEAHQLKGLTFGAVDYLLKPVSIQLLKSRIYSLMDHRAHHAIFVQQALQTKQQISFPNSDLDNEPADETISAAQISKQSHDELLKINIAITPQEQTFLTLVHQQLKLNFKNTDFNAEQLAQLVHMSRSAFYRKFKALTNITPAEHIKIYRLNTAKKLLLDGYTVSEIIRQTGYSDPSSFNRAYKNLFGKNPSDEKAQSKKFNEKGQ
ncbi:ATP-binding protein [Paraglaciecola aquimarina]|uniref:histidine kinase n=1 Tax=Paraglaciecola algarum TaxID=3050085 RepID=A0ABS9D969_9ALTE|nr:ATP-binding protein [Paraglaciecola sp. G1-23]MCF2949503.1 ATP-binding protein [Paraglaciecola sp. G1-23]